MQNNEILNRVFLLKKHTLAGVALCLLRFCPDLFLPFLWVTEADKRSSSGTEFSCCGLCALWWRCGGELLLVCPPVSDMLACPDDRFSSDELLPVHSGRLYKRYSYFISFALGHHRNVFLNGDGWRRRLECWSIVVSLEPYDDRNIENESQTLNFIILF